MSYRIGLDLGSTAIKVVVNEDNELKWYKKVPTAPGQERLARELIEIALNDHGIAERDIERVCATGYGKGLVSFAGSTVDEISANAKGIYSLSGGDCKIIINIGGQDLKVIHLESNGQISSFKMNDKCAAGTGRFFEVAARILDTPIGEFGALSQTTDEVVELNSTCVVFAESEIVSLIAKGAPKGAIVRGLHYSIARRVGNLLGRNADGVGIYLDGGPAQNSGLLEALEDELLMDINVLPQPQFTVAFGATLAA